MTARSAAASLMILGGVVIVALSVGTAWYAIANPTWIDAQLAGLDPAVREQLDGVLTPAFVTQIVVACGIGGVVEGAASIFLGLFVGRGKRWAIRTSVAVTFFRLALVALLLVVTFIGGATITQIDSSTNASHTVTYHGATASGPTTSTLLALVVATGVLIATLVFLFRSRHTTPPVFPVRQ